jgi:uncharacterized SAM-binding protein YcdF (DUF218 family)
MRLGSLPTVRRWRWLVAALAVVGLVSAVGRCFVFPAAEPGGPADAVVLLAGDPETRLPVAVRLARAGGHVLVVSAASGEVNAPARALCRSAVDLTVICVAPAAPAGTRGEARAVGALVAEQGWTRITVVTSSYHTQRAALLVRRCTDAEVRVEPVRPLMSLPRWGAAVGHETAGLATALVHRSC